MDYKDSKETNGAIHLHGVSTIGGSSTFDHHEDGDMKVTKYQQVETQFSSDGTHVHGNSSYSNTDKSDPKNQMTDGKPNQLEKGIGDEVNDTPTKSHVPLPINTSVSRQWLSMWYIAIIIVAPIILLAVIFGVDEKYEKEARCGYVIAVVAIFWVTEALPIVVTAMIPAVLLPMLGVLTAKETSSAFFNDVSMVLLGGLIVAIAVEIWNVHRRIAFLTVRFVGGEPKRLLLGICLVTWLLSVWMSNTATTAMMMTIVQPLLEQYREMYRQKDARKNHHRPSDELSAESQKEYSRLCKAVYLTVAYSANVGGVGSLTGTGPNLVFYSAAQELFAEKGATFPVNFGTWLAYGIPLSLLIVLIVWGWMVIRFLRCRGGPCCGKNGRDDFDVAQINAVVKREYEKLGPISHAEKTVLITFMLLLLCWVTRDFGGPGWGQLFPPKTVSDSTPAILFALLMFILPAYPPRICGKGGWRGRYIKVQPILTWKQVQEKMTWGIFLILGGGYAIAKAATKSGLSAWLGEQLLVFREFNSWAILLIVCYVVAMATEVTSNSATATLLMPILSQMAISLGVNPLLLMYPGAIATSFAFMLPAATPPNAIVFSKGTLKVVDMVTTGIVLNIITVPILVLATATWGDALFNMSTIPPEFVNATLTSAAVSSS